MDNAITLVTPIVPQFTHFAIILHQSERFLDRKTSEPYFRTVLLSEVDTFKSILAQLINIKLKSKSNKSRIAQVCDPYTTSCTWLVSKKNVPSIENFNFDDSNSIQVSAQNLKKCKISSCPIILVSKYLKTPLKYFPCKCILYQRDSERVLP